VLLKEITHSDLHAYTKKTLLIEVDNVEKAQAVLKALGIIGIDVDASASGGNRLALDSHLDAASDIARALVNGGVRLYDLHRQEATLEEYFVRLVGGQDV